MRVTKQQAALNRQRIVDSAIRLFGERGVDSVGVAEVMADAGFTHGGFYNHFSSKEDLVLQACSTSFARSVDSLRRNGVIGSPPDDVFGECLSAAMLSESAKARSLASVYADGLREFLNVMTEQFGDRQRAVVDLARFVGAKVISHAVEAVDERLAAEFLDAVHAPA
jgi:TetR/AcrR family transcriptional regulator, transcriptional repressor for nem operon